MDRTRSHRFVSKLRIVNQIQAGMNQLKDGDLPAARRILEDLLKEAPDLAAVRIGLGRVSYQEKQYKAALDFFQEALQLDPNSAVATALSARAREKLGDMGQARAEYEHASELDPALGFPQTRISQMLAKGDDYGVAARRLREIQEHSPQHVRVRLLLADFLERSGDVAAAKTELERIVEDNPDDAVGLNKLAQISLREKDFEAARAQFERALDLDPDKFGPQFGYGIALASLGEHREALAAFAAAQRLQRNFAPIALWMADSHLALRQPEEALRVLHQAARRSRSPAGLHKRIGDIYVLLGRYVQAVDQYRATVLHKPETVDNDPELRSLLEGGGNPEILARKVQEKLASLSNERDARTADPSSRPRQFGGLRGRLTDAR